MKTYGLGIAIWLVVLLGTPFGLQVWGEGSFPLLAVLGVLAQTGAVILVLRTAKTWRQVARLAVPVFILTWGIEWLGSSTGFPFGRYHYTALLQPQLLGVPLLIPLAWLMMLAPAWGVAQIIQTPLTPGPSPTGGEGRKIGRRFALAALSGLVFTAWDLYLDPQMVTRGLWVWETPGAYFGIPWSNYLGWWLSATLLTLVVRPRDLPARPLLLIYALTWVLQAVALGMFWGQPGPALAGFVGMGIFIGLAVWRLRRAIRKVGESP